MSNPPNKLSVRVDDNQVSFYSPNDDEDNVIITFHRTLRIPDDGKVYPLPPSLGNFPIRRVDDYLDRVPEKWKKQGGVFIPLFQREAMWLEFLNVSTEHPHALKIAVGKVNALSGETWDEDMKLRNVQDYCITPLQPWLDGINGGDGTIKQFIAMPLGQGYTVESQVTGEDKVGGAQIICYNPHDQKRRKMFKQELTRTQPQFVQPQQPIYQQPTFVVPPSNVPILSTPIVPMNQQLSGFSVTSSVTTSSTTTTFNAPPTQPSFQPPVMKKSLSKPSVSVPQNSFGGMPVSEASCDLLGLSVQNQSVQLEKLSLNDNFAHDCCECEEESSFYSPPPPSQSSYSSPPPPLSQSRSSSINHSSEKKKERKSSPKQESKAQELGLASGGKMKQQIIEDPYGFEFWDTTTKARVFVHIVNSEMFAQITGESIPPTPITTQTYSSYGYPWFDHYTENVGSVGKSNILSGVKSVKEVDQQKYAFPQQDDSTVQINNVVTHKAKFEDVRDGEW